MPHGKTDGAPASALAIACAVGSMPTSSTCHSATSTMSHRLLIEKRAGAARCRDRRERVKGQSGEQLRRGDAGEVCRIATKTGYWLGHSFRIAILGARRGEDKNPQDNLKSNLKSNLKRREMPDRPKKHTLRTSSVRRVWLRQRYRIATGAVLQTIRRVPGSTVFTFRSRLDPR